LVEHKIIKRKRNKTRNQPGNKQHKTEHQKNENTYDGNKSWYIIARKHKPKKTNKRHNEQTSKTQTNHKHKHNIDKLKTNQSKQNPLG